MNNLRLDGIRSVLGYEPCVATEGKVGEKGPRKRDFLLSGSGPRTLFSGVVDTSTFRFPVRGLAMFRVRLSWEDFTLVERSGRQPLFLIRDSRLYIL